jgi:hypothetical protein
LAGVGGRDQAAAPHVLHQVLLPIMTWKPRSSAMRESRS